MKKSLLTFVRICCIPYIIIATPLSLLIWVVITFITFLMNKNIQANLWIVRKIGYKDESKGKPRAAYYPVAIIYVILKLSLGLIRALLDIILLGLLSLAVWILGSKWSGLASFKAYKKRLLLRNKLKNK